MTNRWVQMIDGLRAIFDRPGQLRNKLFGSVPIRAIGLGPMNTEPASRLAENRRIEAVHAAEVRKMVGTGPNSTV